MVPQLTALATLAEDWSWAPRTHVSLLTIIQQPIITHSSSSWASDILFWLPEGTCTVAHNQTQSHNIGVKNPFKKLVKFPLADCSSFYTLISREYEVLLAFCFVF